jgi:hypothetical protein
VLNWRGVHIYFHYSESEISESEISETNIIDKYQRQILEKHIREKY